MVTESEVVLGTGDIKIKKRCRAGNKAENKREGKCDNLHTGIRDKSREKVQGYDTQQVLEKTTSCVVSVPDITGCHGSVSKLSGSWGLGRPRKIRSLQGREEDGDEKHHQQGTCVCWGERGEDKDKGLQMTLTRREGIPCG